MKNPSTPPPSPNGDSGQDIIVRDLSFTDPDAGNVPKLKNIRLHHYPFRRTTAIVGYQREREENVTPC